MFKELKTKRIHQVVLGACFEQQLHNVLDHVPLNQFAMVRLVAQANARPEKFECGCNK
jgi:hypothetical protein